MSSQMRTRRTAEAGVQDSSKAKQQVPREEEGVEEMLRKIREIVKQEITEQVKALEASVSSQIKELKSELEKKIVTLEKSIDFAHESVTELKEECEEKTKKVDEKMSGKFQELEDKINRMERHSRAYNLRFYGIAENAQEDCFEKLTEILEDDLGMYNAANEIENAHRTGKAETGRPRQIIAKFYSRPFKHNVLKAFKQRKAQNSNYVIRIVEDLTPLDYKKRKAVMPKMIQAYKEGKKASFRNGNLVINGKIVAV